MDISEKTEAVDLEETPQSRQRKRHAKERETRAKMKKAKETWCEVVGTKVLRKTVTANGNTHVAFICLNIPKNKALIESLKAKTTSNRL